MDKVKSVFHKPTSKEILRKQKRALNRAIRDLDRERIKLEQQEKQLIVNIKNTAKKNQVNACKIMAKDLVRTRRYIQKFYEMKTQLQAVSLRIQTLQSNQTMTEAMKGVSSAMKTMNKQINLPQINKIMMNFEKESELMDIKEEMMNDAIDNVMEEEDDEEESENIVNQIFDEIGISLNQELVDTPQTSLKVSNTVDEDQALRNRLDNLRRE
jgi:charged multivesicular body protein 2A